MRAVIYRQENYDWFKTTSWSGSQNRGKKNKKVIMWSQTSDKFRYLIPGYKYLTVLVFCIDQIICLSVKNCQIPTWTRETISTRPSFHHSSPTVLDSWNHRLWFSKTMMPLCTFWIIKVFSRNFSNKTDNTNFFMGVFRQLSPVTTSGICWWAWLMAPAIFSTHCSVVIVPSEEPGWKLYSFRPSMWQRLSSSTSSSWLFANTSRRIANTKDERNTQSCGASSKDPTNPL